jgi:MFS family permease
MPGRLQPQDAVLEHDLTRGLRGLVADGMCSQAMVTLSQGPILAGFAILLGASNLAIGLIAAVGPLSNVLQVPAIAWLERHGRRKRAVVLSCLASRSLLLPTAAIPWIAPQPLHVPLLVVLLAAQFSLAAVSGCGFNSWVHDLVPSERLGPLFARRMTWAMALGSALSLASGIWLDAGARGGWPEASYLAVFVLAAVAGYVGCGFLASIPEPRMQPAAGGSVRDAIAAPFRDARFRTVLVFVGAWTFAAQLAIPFFAVYLIRRLDLGMAWVLGLSVLSQVAHAVALPAWGRVAARRGDKAVLMMSVPLFSAAAAAWPLAGSGTGSAVGIAVLATIHVLAGVSVAGVTLCAGNLALREAPKGRGTAYLATNSLVAGVAAIAAPLIAGSAADSITAGQTVFALGDLVWKRLDVVFLCAAVLGLLTFRAAVRVRAQGEIDEPLDLSALWAEALRGVLQTSSVAGIRRLVGFPYARLRVVLGRRAPRRPE